MNLTAAQQLMNLALGVMTLVASVITLAGASGMGARRRRRAREGAQRTITRYFIEVAFSKERV